MAWRKKSLDFAGQVGRTIITHCRDLKSQGIAAELCNSNFRCRVVPFAAQAHVQPTPEGLGRILFSKSVCHQVLHSSQSGLQSGIRTRFFRPIFPVVGSEGFRAASKEFSVVSKRGFSNGALLGTTPKVQWVGTVAWKKNQTQLTYSILPVFGKRNFNFATTTERLKSSTTTQKAKETFSKAKIGATEVRSNELLSGILKPVNSAKQTVMGLRQALGLHLEAFWKRNYLVVVGAVAVFACLLLWQIMFGIASLFVSLSEGMAKFGFLALAAGMVAIGGVLTRARYMVNPDTVYRIAMRKLNTSAAVLGMMGAPLTGTDVCAYVMSGGGLRFKNFRPRLRSKHCFLIFPITGV